MTVIAIKKIITYILFIVACLGIIFTVTLTIMVDRWDKKNTVHKNGLDAFVNGTLGTELAPLSVFEVLPKIFPEEFNPLGSYLGIKKETQKYDWIQQFGFINREYSPIPIDKKNKLPVGFTYSYYRPESGAPSPIVFVGLSCVACHSAEIKTSYSKHGKVVYGAGNQNLNLLAFTETNPSDPNSKYILTVNKIEEVRGSKLSITEKVFIDGWLSALRSDDLNSLKEYQRVIDEPYNANEVFNSQFILSGPNRTQPFRSLVRIHLDRPGWSNSDHQMDQGFSKIPPVFLQDSLYHGSWAQFDGSVKSITARSTLAASTAGANVNNLAIGNIANNLILSAEHTRHFKSPKWSTVFGSGKNFKINKKLASEGQKVYATECAKCHGVPTHDGGWTWYKNSKQNLFGQIIPIGQIQTDPERLKFRHKDEIAGVISDKFDKSFGKNHPLKFDKSDLRTTNGYYAGPLTGAFLRTPYLHNASILTLADLIGINERKGAFMRGGNIFDPINVGMIAPPFATGKMDSLRLLKNQISETNNYFYFDTKVRGNSNKGHYYPTWAFNPNGKIAKHNTKEQQNLNALLEYLKTL
jgi:cytochrome c553